MVRCEQRNKAVGECVENWTPETLRFSKFLYGLPSHGAIGGSLSYVFTSLNSIVTLGSGCPSQSSSAGDYVETVPTARG